jgi:anti-anti-sigma factor
VAVIAPPVLRSTRADYRASASFCRKALARPVDLEESGSAFMQTGVDARRSHPDTRKPETVMAAILEHCTHPSVLEVDERLQAPVNSRLIQHVQTRLFRGERRILLDLSRVTAIDAAGVGELIGAFNATRAAGGELRVAHANRRVFRLLEVAGVLWFLAAGAKRVPSLNP